jgi:hypothetical protein
MLLAYAVGRGATGIVAAPMERTPTRCGYCGRQTITHAGRCPSCGQEKHPPAAMKPPKPPSMWREIGSQLAAGAVTLLLIVTAILIGSQVLLFLGILVLCALAVLFVVSNGVP